MNNPYDILGVSPNASDSEVKAAYRNLAKKYHPDNYADDSLREMASEKMKEINGAYDQIVSERKGRTNSGSQSYYNTYAQNQNVNSKYPDVRRYIQSGRINDAEQILDGVPDGSRDAEWYFLKGTILLKKGWMDEAHSHFQRACNMDPQNMEYSQALNYTESARNGSFGGYRQNGNGMNSGCTSCDVCSGLLCADCCCECFGGDIIPCC